MMLWRVSLWLQVDSEALTLEFSRVPYDDALSEAKAAAGGFRMHPWLHFLYAAQRRILVRLGSLKHRNSRNR